MAAEAKKAPVPPVTHVNDILHSFFSNVEVYISNHQIYNSNGLYAHNFYISNNLKGILSDYKEVLHRDGFDYEEFPDEIMESLFSEHFLTRRRKMISRPDGVMFYGKLGVDSLSSALLYPNIKFRLRLIRARANFNRISGNPNVSLGSVDCSLYTRCIAVRDDYHKKRLNMFSNTPAEFNYL